MGMTEEELASRVEAIQEDHRQALLDDLNPSTEGVMRAPTDDELEILHLDKCIATARAFGIPADPAEWAAAGPGSFTLDANGTNFVFNADTGMSGRRTDGQWVEIHSQEDVRALLDQEP
jgi:hypothetical protein